MKAALMWALLIFYFSVLPGTSSGGVDNSLPTHFIAYFVLTALLLWSQIEGVKAVTISTGYGALMEIIQFYVPGRHFGLSDMAINALASVTAYLLLRLFYKEAAI